MSIELILALAGLALVDSTSFSAIGVPVFILLSSPRPPVTRMLMYLATVVAFYFGLGVALMFGLDQLLTLSSGWLESRTAYWVQLVIGVALFGLSFRFDSKKQPDRPIKLPALGSPWAMVGLGLTTSVLEVATMLPYLAAIGMMTAAGLAVAEWMPLLAGYTLVMVLPPILLLIVSVIANDRLRPYLERIGRWFQKHSRDIIGWTLGIVGFLLALDAASNLGLVDMIQQWEDSR